METERIVVNGVEFETIPGLSEESENWVILRGKICTDLHNASYVGENAIAALVEKRPDLEVWIVEMENENGDIHAVEFNPETAIFKIPTLRYFLNSVLIDQCDSDRLFDKLRQANERANIQNE